MTCVSVLSDHANGKKAPIVSEGFYPKAAIIDPELTYTMPPAVTAGTGIDVLSHAIEGYWSKGHQPICDTLAIHAAALVFKYLYRAYENPSDEEAREKMCEASVIAGLAFTLPKTTSSHACSFPLTNIYHIPHGEACGLTLDYFVRINARGTGSERVETLAKALGFADAEALADAIFALKQKLGLRCDLKDLHLEEEQIAELVKISRHPNLYNNPVEITDEMLDKMYSILTKKLEEIGKLNLPIGMIAPSHGAIWRTDPLQIVENTPSGLMPTRKTRLPLPTIPCGTAQNPLPTRSLRKSMPRARIQSSRSSILPSPIRMKS